MNSTGMHEVHLKCSPRSRKLKRLLAQAPLLRVNTNCDPANIPAGSLCYQYPAGFEWEFDALASAAKIEIEWGGVGYVAVFTLGDYLYALDDVNSLHIWDNTDPASPVAAGSLNIGGTPAAMCISNSILYTTDTSGILSCINIDDPAAPVVEPSGTGDTGDNYGSIRVIGDIAILSGPDASSVALWDVGQRPPKEIQTIDGLSGSQAITQGRRLYFGDTSGSPRALLRNYRWGGSFCHAIHCYDLHAETQVHAEKIAARDGDFKGEVDCNEIEVTQVIRIGGRWIIPVTGNPNTVVTAPIGSLGLSDDGSIYHNTDGATAWSAL